MTKRKRILIFLLFTLYVLLVWGGAYPFLSGANYFLIGVVLSALGLTVLLVYLLVSRISARSAPQPAPADGGAQPAAAAPATSGPDPDIDAILALLREANGKLATSPTLASKRVRTTVTNLPLYLVAGAEGSGKTSTFLNAGLEPELLAGQIYRDSAIVPTRLANFWYAGDALFAEASGAFFSQDAGRWRRLLDALQGRSSLFTSKRSLLRGVILCCDITPFTGIADPNRLTALGRRVQERLRTIGESFGSSFPVYVIFTKSDQVPYFGDYFGRMAETEDQQVLGCTLPISAATARPAGEIFAESESARLGEAFNTLYESLAGKRLVFLAREMEGAKKPAIYEFPREMKRTRDVLVQFLVDAFRPNPLQPSPILRGFYFTGTRKVAASAASSGAFANPVMTASAGEATSLFNLADYQKKMGLVTSEGQAPAQALVPRWSFVSDLFHQVILPDPSSARGTFVNRRADLYKRIAFGALAFVCAVLAFCFIRSWYGNSALLDNVEQATKLPYSYRANAREIPNIDALRSLEALRVELESLLEYDREGPPWRLRWSLYSGNRVLPGLYDLYFQRFRQIFFDDAHNTIAAGLIRLPGSADAANGYNSVYDRLKAYRMITSRGCKPDKAFLTPVVMDAWLAGRPVDTERLALASRQVSFYSEELGRKNPYKVEEKGEALDRSRQYLSSFGGADRLYRGLVEEGSKSPRRAARLADIAPNFRQVLTGPGEVMAAFTREGWQFVDNAIRGGNRNALGEPCVLGGIGAVAAPLLQSANLDAEMRNLYVADYIRKWKEFIASTGVAPFASASDASKKLEVLADNRSPLLASIFLVADNTAFPASAQNAATQAAAAAAPGFLDKLLPAKARNAVDAAKQAAPRGAPARSISDISRIFQPATTVVSPANRERLIDDPNRNYMNAIADLQRAMQRLENDRPSNPDLAAHDTARRAVEAGMDNVRLISQKFNLSGAEGVDVELKRLLESPFRAASRFIITDPSKVGRDKAAGAAKAFCAKLAGLERKFPFNPQGEAEITADEFAAVFAPQTGALAALQQQFGKLVVKQGRQWVQSLEAQDPRLTPEFLAFFNRMSGIQDAFFADGTPQPKLRYSLRPVPGTNMQSLALEIDGQRAEASGANSASKQFTWPAAPASQQTVVRVRAGANIPFASYEGLWSVFRMMADADPRPAGSRTIELSKVRRGRGRPEAVLDQSDKPIVVRLEIGDLPNGVDVFDKGFFQFRCPGRIAE